MSHTIAIVIPTNGNREDWLDLIDRHYRVQSAKVDIHIVRGGTNPYDAIIPVLPEITAKYVLFSGDDDFYFTDHLYQMAQFLEGNPHIPGGYGQALLMGLNGFEIHWSVNYPMVYERSFSLLRNHIFKQCVGVAGEVLGGGRSTWNFQAWLFNNECDKFGDRIHYPGLQMIHGHHTGRMAETYDPEWRKFIERWGGGWLASWLPSRSGSLRAIKRGDSPFHPHYLHMNQLLETFRGEKYRAVIANGEWKPEEFRA